MSATDDARSGYARRRFLTLSIASGASASLLNDLAFVVSRGPDRGYRVGSTHSEEGATNTSPVASQNLADAQWL